MTIEELLRSRRSINKFKSKKPADRLILEAIDVARWAPNHHLTEPWRFYLIGNETRQSIIELNTRLVSEKKGREAGMEKQKKWSMIPGWLAVTVTNSNDTLQQQEDYAACCCAIQNLCLFLWEEGVGCKWTTGPVTRDDEAYNLLWIDQQYETIVGLIWYGYPDEEPDSIRKPVNEILVRLP